MDTWTQKPLIRFAADHCIVNYDSYDEDTKQAIREIGVRNMLIEQRLQELLQKLQEKHIPAIVMKGCHLIKSVYPFGIRPIEDIDILLDRKNFAAADEAVRSLGYEDRAFGMDVWTHVEVSNKMTYMNREQPLIPIDIHYTLGPYPYLGRIPFDVLLEHSEILETTEMEMRVLRPEMLLVHLCLHLFQHHDEHWEVSAYDLSTLTTLRQQMFDWSRFIAIITKYSLQLPIQHSIKKAARLAVIHIPDSVLGQINSIPVMRREQLIFQGSQSLIHGMEKHVLQLLTLPGFKLKLQCLQRIIIPRRSFLHHYYRGSYVSYIVDICRTAARAVLRSRS